MSRADHHLKHSIMGMLGSFWSRAVTEKTKGEARAIATLAADAEDLRRLDVPMQKMIGGKRSQVERVRVSFLDGDFVYIGREIASVWRASMELADGTYLQVVRRNLSDSVPRSQLLVGSNGRPLGSNLGHLLAVTSAPEGMTGADSLFVVPVPSGLTPIVIATRFQDRVLVQGIDFEAGDGFIIMRESPGEVFRAGGFTVLTGTVELRLPYNFTMQVNGPAHGHAFIAAYYKGAVSRTSFEKAAAQACGLLVLEQDDMVMARLYLTESTTRYILKNAGPVDIDYPHEALVPGRSYQRGFIVGNGFRVVGSSTTGWLARDAGANTLRVDGVTSIPDTFLPPGPVAAYHVESGTSPHARVSLQATPTSLIALWRKQKNHELANSAYLSDLIGMATSQPRVSFDFHQMIETFYGARLLLVLPNLDGAPASYLDRLREFVAREKPVGSAVVITEGASGFPLPGSYEPEAPESELPESEEEAPLLPSGGLAYDEFFLAFGEFILVHDGP